MCGIKIELQKTPVVECGGVVGGGVEGPLRQAVPFVKKETKISKVRK